VWELTTRGTSRRSACVIWILSAVAPMGTKRRPDGVHLVLSFQFNPYIVGNITQADRLSAAHSVIRRKQRELYIDCWRNIDCWRRVIPRDPQPIEIKWMRTVPDFVPEVSESDRRSTQITKTSGTLGAGRGSRTPTRVPSADFEFPDIPVSL
jgi:hypothetical protein